MTLASSPTALPKRRKSRLSGTWTRSPSNPTMFDDAVVGWRAGITDGKEWSFYDYNRDAPDGEKLTPVNTLSLNTPDDDEALLAYLYDFVNRTVKMAPPTDNVRWAEGLAQPFLNLAVRYESRSEYDVKHKLWEGVLRGAFIIPPDDPDSKRELFARHTMLVVIARAIAETLRPPELAAAGEQLHRTLTEGFAAWLIDAAEDEGAAAIDALVAEVNNYAWSASNRDMLKDLYHAVISRDIRHDFGEYYTPDWLARAVCEEGAGCRLAQGSHRHGCSRPAQWAGGVGPVLRFWHLPVSRCPTALGKCTTASRTRQQSAGAG